MKLINREKYIISLSMFYVFLVSAIIGTISTTWSYEVETMPFWFAGYLVGAFSPAIIMYFIAKHFRTKPEDKVEAS